MPTPKEAERRRRTRVPRTQIQDLKISCYDQAGAPRAVVARLVDVSDGGLAVKTTTRLAVDSTVFLTGEMVNGGVRVDLRGRARVAHCQALTGGSYRIGLSFQDLGRSASAGAHKPPPSGEAEAETGFVDYYEALMLSPNADLDTIHRVYRILAQRCHPDNRETGSEDAFKQLLKVYQVLSDPVSRAAYDVHYRSARSRRWKVLDQAKAAEGLAGEKHKRQAILSLLYARRLNQPLAPTLALLEMEEVMGCPRAQLEFSLWYLKENGWIHRSDNGQLSITAVGVDQAEAHGLWRAEENKLLPAARAVNA